LISHFQKTYSYYALIIFLIGLDQNKRADVRNSVLHAFVAAGNAQLFGNSLMRLVIQYKWDSYARHIFMRFVLLLKLIFALTKNDIYIYISNRDLGFFCIYLCLYVAFSLVAGHTSNDEDLTRLIKSRKFSNYPGFLFIYFFLFKKIQIANL
jgi:hypothetical protein